MLVAGAGLSAGLVPLPSALISSWKSAAEEQLKIESIAVDLTDSDALYHWAEIALARLHEYETPLPKLRLAEALGLLSEPTWTAKVGLPLRGTMPRHRVLARFARERKWSSVWSLNWDTHIENALERIGLQRDKLIDGQPWITAYRTIMLPDDFRYLSQTDQFFCLLKPHGCVYSLIQAQKFENDGQIQKAAELSERFMITKQELEEERTNQTDKKFFEKFRSQLNESPLVVIGWRISEPYLKAVINETLEGLINEGREEEFTVVDIEFNGEGHHQTAQLYKLSQSDVFMRVDKDHGKFNCDEFFIWLQARYALDQIRTHIPKELPEHIDILIADAQKATLTNPVLQWADVFLPAWVRLCWRAELVRSVGFEPHQLRIELEDEHIPWDQSNLPRPDLAAAGILLASLIQSGVPWDCEAFPGGLFNRQEGRLVLPLPAWGGLNDLAAVRPLLQVVERDIAYVEQVDILLVPPQYGQRKPEPVVFQRMKELVSSYMRVPRFAAAEQLGVAADFPLLWEA